MNASHFGFCLVLSLGLIANGSEALQGQIINAPQPQYPSTSTPNAALTSSSQPSPKVEATTKPSDEKTAWPKLSMPKLSMPDMKVPKLNMPTMSQVLSPVSVGYQKVSSGTKKAWEGTKDMLSFGKSDEKVKITSTRSSKSSSGNSLWDKLTARKKQPAGPQTVGEWMSQPRLQP